MDMGSAFDFLASAAGGHGAETDIISLISRASMVAKLVLLILVVMAVVTIALVISKWIQFRRAMDENRQFLNVFWNEKSVEEAFSKEVKPGGLLPGKDYPTIRASHAKKGVYGHKAWNQPKLTVSHRRVAIALEACGATRSAIAKEFGVTGTTVTNLIEGTGAYDVSNPYFK